MQMLNTRYLTDSEGKPVAVVLDLEEYNQLLEQLEELEDIRAFDEAKALNETPIPFEQVHS
jgi:PHD/YefM family antitoxin component YafN of YafNO toxin-antitoxin module